MNNKIPPYQDFIRMKPMEFPLERDEPLLKPADSSAGKLLLGCLQPRPDAGPHKSHGARRRKSS